MSYSQDVQPSYGAIAITKNDSVDNTGGKPVRALYVGGEGNISVLTTNGQTILFANAPAGTIIPIRTSRVLSTSTTATNIVGLY